jgi:hypothetical protein
VALQSRNSNANGEASSMSLEGGFSFLSCVSDTSSRINRTADGLVRPRIQSPFPLGHGR